METLIVTLAFLYLIVDLLDSYFNSRTKLVSDLKIGKKEFAVHVLHWCIQNIQNNNKSFNLKIIYQKPTKRLGYYQFYNNEITIYIDDSIYLLELVDTIIHEYIHHLQMINNNHQKEYIDKLSSIGYENHPMEVEARQLANKFRNSCYDSIIKKVA